MNKVTRNLLLILMGAFMLGCSVGDMPKGASGDQMKETFNKLPIEERAKMLIQMPGSKEGKEKRIREMYQKEGKTPPDDIFSLAGNKGPGPGTPAPGSG
ncbi:MAG TPA: hypothetical protein VG944_16270 [Fimbriimonas sp.]|nr:hypothetical protein [Fimbriimonas sp.]